MRSFLRLPNVPALRGSIRTTLLCLLVLAAAGCADVLGSGDEPQPGILFLRHADGDSVAIRFSKVADIYRMNADGTGVKNLTLVPAVYGSLSLSPDGRKVAFHSNRWRPWELGTQIWVMNTDGSNPSQLTHGWYESTPRWSPDGTRIAYQHVDDNNALHVYVMNADGSDPRNATRAVMDNTCSSTTARTGISLIGWLPDGRIAFSRFFCGGEGYRFYTVNADGSGLATTTFDMNDAYWSPDGSRVAYTTWVGSTRRLFIMNADGSGVRQLTDHGAAHDLPPQEVPHFRSDYTPWSPDGKRIVFYVGSGGYPDLGDCADTSLPYVINADGSGLTQLKDFCGEFNGWSPGSDRIMFTSWKDGVRDVYTVRADGTGLVNVTRSPIAESSALWLPRR